MIPHALIRSHLRRIWTWSEARKDAKKRARLGRGFYRCEKCGFYTSKVEVDHVDPIGPTPGSRNATAETTWDLFINRLFLGKLQAICPKCHQEKTLRGAA